MTKLKRFVSALLVSCMMFSALMMNAGAVSNSMTTTEITHDMSNTLTLDINNKPVAIDYHVANGIIDSVTINDDVITRKGNEVFCNGVKIATITTTTDFASSDIEPYTSWIYGKNICPSGYSPSDYNKLYGTKWHNVTFTQAITDCTVTIILGTLIMIVPFENEIAAKSVFQMIATSIVAMFQSYAGKDTVYAYESIYAGGMPYTRKNIFEFYGDKKKNDPAGTTTCYSAWA